jgi:hypothetical protein
MAVGANPPAAVLRDTRHSGVVRTRPVDDIGMIQTTQTLYYGRIDVNAKPNSREDRHEEL